MSDKNKTIKSHRQLQKALNHTKLDTWVLQRDKQQLNSTYTSSINPDAHANNHTITNVPDTSVEQPTRFHRLLNSISGYYDKIFEMKCRKHLQAEIAKLIEKKKLNFSGTGEDEIALITSIMESIHTRAVAWAKPALAETKHEMFIFTACATPIFVSAAIISLITGTFPFYLLLIGGVTAALAIYNRAYISYQLPNAYHEIINTLARINTELYAFVNSDKSFAETHRETLESARQLLQLDPSLTDAPPAATQKKTHHRIKHHRRSSVEKGTLFAKENTRPAVGQESQRMALLK